MIDGLSVSQYLYTGFGSVHTHTYTHHLDFTLVLTSWHFLRHQHLRLKVLVVYSHNKSLSYWPRHVPPQSKYHSGNWTIAELQKDISHSLTSEEPAKCFWIITANVERREGLEKHSTLLTTHTKTLRIHQGWPGDYPGNPWKHLGQSHPSGLLSCTSNLSFAATIPYVKSVPY